MTNLEVSALPSMEPYYLNPLQKDSSLYGVAVCKIVADYVAGCDKGVMKKYLMQMCRKIASILKRQRGNQYGFVGDPDSPDHISKNMDEKNDG